MTATSLGFHSREATEVFFGWVLFQTLNNTFVGQSWCWRELNQWQSVEANHVPDKLLSAPRAKITLMINQLIRCHASITDDLEAFFI
jgi:hypothetical protein